MGSKVELMKRLEWFLGRQLMWATEQIKVINWKQARNKCMKLGKCVLVLLQCLLCWYYLTSVHQVGAQTLTVPG